MKQALLTASELIRSDEERAVEAGRQMADQVNTVTDTYEFLFSPANTPRRAAVLLSHHNSLDCVVVVATLTEGGIDWKIDCDGPTRFPEGVYIRACQNRIEGNRRRRLHY